MSQLTAGKKTRKKQSKFQKLWAKAEKLKTENARFRDRLDEIIQRMANEVRPLENRIALTQIPLLGRLLTLGQRKSLTKWQRGELDAWVRELLEPLVAIGDLDAELKEDLARYDAFRSGVELDEDSSTPLVDQFKAHVAQAEKQAQEAERSREDDWHKTVEAEVEQILDDMLGPEPAKPEKQQKVKGDLFQEELEDELQSQYEKYQQERKAARKDLLEAMLGTGEDYFAQDEDEDFDFDPFASDTEYARDADDRSPAISNEIFKRLFRATAAKLHPDRETDPDLHAQKHALMSRLLDARKRGDVMTVVEMYHQHVGDASLSIADEKQLIETLQQQIAELEDEQEDYRYESPLHRVAFEEFYHSSPRKIDQAFKLHQERMEIIASESQKLAQNIKTLKTLKPYLEQRYDDHRFGSTLDAMEEFFNRGF